MAQALLVIDYINEIADSKGKIAQKGYSAYMEHHFTLNRVNTLIRHAREKNIPIIFVRVGFEPDYSNCPTSSPLFSIAKAAGVLKLGSWSTEFHENLQIKEGDTVITKHRVSPFFNTLLDIHLGDMNIDTLYIAGVATDLAVESTARDAHDRDYTVIVVEDCCAAANDEEHLEACKTISKIATLVKVDELEF